MSTAKPKSTAHRIISIVLNVIVYTFFAICAVTLVFSLITRQNNQGAIALFGRQYMTVLTNSMEKSENSTDVSDYEIKDIPVNSMIVIDPVPEDEAEAKEWYDALKEGDVLTFRYWMDATGQITITHRITSKVANDNGGYDIVLEGDNKSSDAHALTQTIDTSEKGSLNYVIGKVTGQAKLLGTLVSIVKSPVGIICFIIIPSVIVAIFEIVRIVSVIAERRRATAKAQQDAEMEALRRQIEELQRGSCAPDDNHTTAPDQGDEE